MYLTFTYETPQTEPALEDKDAGLIVAPPEDEIEALYHLARLGNMQDILRWENHLDALDKRYRPFTNPLRVLAKGYQSKAILNFAKYPMQLQEIS